MGTAKEDARARDVIETGAEPEFVVYDMDRWIDAGDGLIQVFVVSRKGKVDRTEYSFICTPDRLALMCRKGLMFAAEAHTGATFRAGLNGH